MRYLVIVYSIIAVMGLALLAAVHARAHSWYPVECCHQQDCAEVTEVSFVAADPEKMPLMVVTTVHGTATVAPTAKRYPSKDARMHACLTLGKNIKDVRCLFLPPGN